MEYNEIVKKCEALSYRDKFKLAQLLIQYGRKEEELQNPAKREISKKVSIDDDINSVEYIAKRLLKLKPTKLKSLKNSIKAMFQFKGSISEEDENKIILELQKEKYIRIENNKVVYL